MPNIELTVSEDSQIELSVSSDSAVELGIAEQIISGGGGGGNYQDKTVNITPTESAQSQTVHADVGYDALDDVTINVGAIDDEYVGSAVPRKSSSDLTASGATVTAPAGYYAASASESVQSGTEGTPTATKGAVSNHAISVTPSVTNAAGYIGGGTKTGTAVSVSASELVSGTKSITSNGTGIDVTEFADIDVAVPNSYTSADEGKVVSNGALVAQTSDTVTQNGTVDTTLISSLLVNVSGGTIQYATGTYKPTQTYNSTGNRQICTLSDIGFTPTRFILRVKTLSSLSQTQYAVIEATYESGLPLRTTARYSNTSGGVGASVNVGAWTTQTNYFLYYNSNTVYFRTTSQFILIGNVEYTWEAYA